MAAIQSQNTSFTFNDGTTAQTVGGIKSYSGFDGSAEEIDTTTLASTAKEYQVGLEDFGNLTLEINVDHSDVGQEAMRAAKTAGATRECVLTLSDSTTATFNAFVVTFPQSGGTSEVDSASVNLRITGAVTWA
jgi:hypothetical protein